MESELQEKRVSVLVFYVVKCWIGTDCKKQSPLKLLWICGCKCHKFPPPHSHRVSKMFFLQPTLHFPFLLVHSVVLFGSAGVTSCNISHSQHTLDVFIARWAMWSGEAPSKGMNIDKGRGVEKKGRAYILVYPCHEVLEKLAFTSTPRSEVRFQPIQDHIDLISWSMCARLDPTLKMIDCDPSLVHSFRVLKF